MKLSLGQQVLKKILKHSKFCKSTCKIGIPELLSDGYELRVLESVLSKVFEW